jgi:gamma-glutamyl-gamma-aminobutyraldehyde dehydrogenase
MNTPTATGLWHERARALDIRTQAFINGRYVEAATGATFDSINPATGQ